MGENIYIGDIHGLRDWEDIVKQHPNADNIVFIGDYFDSFNISGMEQLLNFHQIIDFKKWRELDPTKKVHLLIGNHDIHYWPGNKDGGGTSGFQPTMMYQFQQFFQDHIDQFKMCVIIGNKLCTHAGVSDVFLKDRGYVEGDVDVFLNDLFKYKPNEFLFHAFEKYSTHPLYPSHYGDDVFQSPIWIRPESLQKSNKNSFLKTNYIQIVGHTYQNKLNIKTNSTGGKYYYIDTLPNGEYLIEKNNKLEIGKLWEK